MRIWDVDPYPEETMYLVFTDVDALAMATAQPERNNINYISDEKLPIVWYLMDTDIPNQGIIIEQAIKEMHEWNSKVKLRMIWQPLNGKRHNTFYKKDIIEIADIMVKIKDWGGELEISIKAGLAKIWYPRGPENHDKALTIARLNLAMEVLSFY